MREVKLEALKLEGLKTPTVRRLMDLRLAPDGGVELIVMHSSSA